MLKITYKTDFVPQVEEIVDLFHHSGYFPIEDKSDAERIKKMFENADIIVSAWDGEKLVGLARSLTDFCYCCYLSDLCVADDYKVKGIGRELVMLTKEKAGERCKLVLQSSEIALKFYERIGMERIDSAFIIQRKY